MASLVSFQSLLLHTLPGVLVTLTPVAGRKEFRRVCTWWWYLFFSLLAFLLEVLLAGEEFGGFGAKGSRGFLTGLLQES